MKKNRPAPKKPTPVKPTPVKPTPVKPTLSPGLPMSPVRGNVETNYRGVPGLVNATAPVPGVRPSTGMPPPDMSRTVLPGPPSGGAPAMGGTFANQLLDKSAPSGGATGSTGFKSGFGGFGSNMFAPSGGAPGNPTGLKLPPGPGAVMQGMKKGGSVKPSKSSKASSASKRGDGIATKGKTKGRFV